MGFLKGEEADSPIGLPDISMKTKGTGTSATLEATGFTHPQTATYQNEQPPTKNKFPKILFRENNDPYYDEVSAGPASTDTDADMEPTITFRAHSGPLANLLFEQQQSEPGAGDLRKSHVCTSNDDEGHQKAAQTQ